MSGSALCPGFCVVVILATACSSQSTAKSTTSTKQAASLTPVGDPPSGRWARYRAHGGGTDVDVYLAHSAQPKPVVVLLHGSGCAPEFTRESDGSFQETSIFQDAIGAALDRVHVAVVERRGVEPLAFSADMSDETKRLAFERAEKECSAEYFQQATKPARVADTVTAIRALRITATRSGSSMGNGRMRTFSTTPKTAAFTPIASASVLTAANVRPGARRRTRMLFRKSDSIENRRPE